MAHHNLPLQPKYRRLIASGQKTKEFRLAGRRSRSITAGDVIDFGGLACSVLRIREYGTAANITTGEEAGSGFDSLPALQAALSKIYWYPGAEKKAILVFDLQVLSPRPAVPLPFAAP